jgi:uncharacterized membrane protein YidH (DUF202 family)
MFPIRRPDYFFVGRTSPADEDGSHKNMMSPNHCHTTTPAQHRRNPAHRHQENHHDKSLGVQVITPMQLCRNGNGSKQKEEEIQDTGIEIKKCDDEFPIIDIESSSCCSSNQTARTTVRSSFSSENTSNSSIKHSHHRPAAYFSSFQTNDEGCTEKEEEEESKNRAVDPSVILSMERTMFAALNNAWLLAIGGVGLMSVGHDDYRATTGGIVILIGAIVTAMMAYGMHILRVVQLRKNADFRYSHSVLWASMIASFTIVTLFLELNFGIMYPYLQREKTVTIADDYDYSSPNNAQQ